ncbi:hypothetical protein G6011_06704 [Alternaria panax]|uniref:Uncharacterized protein n=1 Tax=Alternaria panax TaxID=48097 RepID=A0AAD4I9H1_9PLEO|nr:hypothetical protein G6011_06704 [Alternaria panax]
MPSLPLTSSATLRVPKRACDEEVVESSKQPRQSEFQAPPEYPTDFASAYHEALPKHSPPSMSSPPPIYSVHPATSDTHLQDTQRIATEYGTFQDGVYAPGLIYGDPDEQYGLAVASQPPPVPQLSYRSPGPDYQHYAGEQFAPTVQDMDTPGIPVPQTQRNQDQNYTLHPSLAANTSPREQSIEEKLYLGLIADGYGECISPSVIAERAVWERLYDEQNQWLTKAEPDLQGHAINVVPGIHIEQGVLGSPAGINNDLIPSEVWSLRCLSPSLRYGAYRMLTEEAREMIAHHQASEEFQNRWARIVNFRAGLMQKEREWMEFFQQIVDTHRRAYWDQKVEQQAVETPVDQAMVVLFEQSKIEARAKSLVGVTVDNEAPQSLASQPALATATPATKKKTINKVRNPTSQSGAAVLAPTKPPKPDTIKHPMDKAAVPKYPFDDISDFTPNGNGIYQCMHGFGRNFPCCINGLNEDRMKQAIYRSINTWKSQVEREIHNGNLHPSHMTWPTHRNVALKRDHDAVEEARAEFELQGGEGEAKRDAKGKKQKKQKKATDNKVKAVHVEKKLRDSQQAPLEDDTVPRPSFVPALYSPEQHNTTVPTLSPNKLATKVAFEWGNARVDMRDKQDFENCWRLEFQKKWPNWSRFEQWWAARLLQVQCSKLSLEQKIILRGQEPSIIADKDPRFVKKTNEPLPSKVQETADVEEDNGLEDVI